MALTPINNSHALQIQAGMLGRNLGHKFELDISAEINGFTYPFYPALVPSSHLFVNNPAISLLNYIGCKENITEIISASAICTGALATSQAGKVWLSVNGFNISRCKSDLIVNLNSSNGRCISVGISTKQCNHRNPTNAQLYFTTATAFSNLLNTNGIHVSPLGLLALRQFCGDLGFRPCDNNTVANRIIDPRRYFWEETHLAGRLELEQIFSLQQDNITRLLLQKAYLNDPFIPNYLLHKTKYAASWSSTEVAIYTIDEITNLSRLYQGFAKRPYSVRKGSFPDPTGLTHDAPRFGIVQMQRGGQAQHPTQLQFNLEAGYFYKV